MKLLVVLLSACALASGGIIPLIDDRIIGGDETTIEEHPYLTSVRYRGGDHCGGSILNRDTILTAAHCINGFVHKYITVRVGSTVHSEGEEYEVAKIIEHPDYFKGALYNNDMAILKLAKPLTFSNKIQPIALQPSSSRVPAGTTALVSGWGTTVSGERHTSDDKLRVVDVEVITNERCQRSYEGAMLITSTMLCAQTPQHDSCQGDSGGPLTANGKLIGVVSWGFGCAIAAYPGVYANVSALHKFASKYM